jgi:hypothetical protein
MKIDTDITPFAKLVQLGSETIYPGWYIRYYVGGHLLTERLEISDEAEANDAHSEAAVYLGCARNQVQVESTVGGSVLPRPA